MCLGYVWKRNVVCSLMLYNKIQRSRGSTSQSDFSLTIPGLTGIDFEPRQEKTGRKTSWSKGLRREATTTQPTYGAATTPVFEPCLHCGRRVLSPLRTPASLKRSKQTTHSLVLTLTALPHSRSTHFTLEGTVSAHKIFIFLPLAKRFKPRAECT